MKADTFAKLVVLETLIDAEVGFFLEHQPPSVELFRESMVSRVSDLVDEIDELDAVAAARIYDAIVDFLAELPENDAEAMVEARLRFRRAMDRLVERGMDQREMQDVSTWAIVLDELLKELADEYHVAIRSSGEVRSREYLRAQTLLARAREAADRMLWEAGDEPRELRDEMDRLTFAVRHRRLKPTVVDFQIRALQRRAARYRPSNLTRIGTFILSQVLRREGRRGGGGPGDPRPAKGA
jgi:hypothetical protein